MDSHWLQVALLLVPLLLLEVLLEVRLEVLLEVLLELLLELLLLGELPVVLMVLKMLVVSVMVSVASMISTIWMTLDSLVLVVEVMWLVKVVTGEMMVVGVNVMFIMLTTVVVLPLPESMSRI